MAGRWFRRCKRPRRCAGHWFRGCTAVCILLISVEWHRDLRLVSAQAAAASRCTRRSRVHGDQGCGRRALCDGFRLGHCLCSSRWHCVLWTSPRGHLLRLRRRNRARIEGCVFAREHSTHAGVLLRPSGPRAVSAHVADSVAVGRAEGGTTKSCVQSITSKYIVCKLYLYGRGEYRTYLQSMVYP